MDERKGTPELQRPPAAGWTFLRALGWLARGLGFAVRRRPRVALGVLSVLLLVAAIVPQLRLLGATSQPRAQVKTTPTATPTLAPADPHALDWIYDLHYVAETTYINDLMAHMSVDEKVGQLICSSSSMRR